MNKKEIEQQIHEFAEKMYKAGYADGNNTNLIDEAYREGLNDAWECVKRIVYPTEDGGLSTDGLKEIFGTLILEHIVTDYSPSEAIQKIKDWEEKQKQKEDEIRVGDEVIVNDIDRKAIVIGISTFEDWDAPYNILFENGNTDWVRKDIISKTGKHYSQIAEVLKELRGDEE